MASNRNVLCTFLFQFNMEALAFEWLSTAPPWRQEGWLAESDRKGVFRRLIDSAAL